MKKTIHAVMGQIIISIAIIIETISLSGSKEVNNMPVILAIMGLALVIQRNGISVGQDLLQFLNMQKTEDPQDE